MCCTLSHFKFSVPTTAFHHTDIYVHNNWNNFILWDVEEAPEKTLSKLSSQVITLTYLLRCIHQVSSSLRVPPDPKFCCWKLNYFEECGSQARFSRLEPPGSGGVTTDKVAARLVTCWDYPADDSQRNALVNKKKLPNSKLIQLLLAFYARICKIVKQQHHPPKIKLIM